MNDIPTTLSILGCLWVFAALVTIGWVPRIVNYLVRYSRVHAVVLEESQDRRSPVPAAQLARFVISLWLTPGEVGRRLPEIPMTSADRQIEGMMAGLYPRHRLAAAAFMICLLGLTIATAAFF